MVARISSGSSPGGAVDYNEKKVGKGEAQRLAIRNYEIMIQQGQELTADVFKDILRQQASNNDLVKKPTFHVSLALAQGEKPSAEELISIADRYMNGMGYGSQPYAVYQHHDTDHTHIHIVSVRVDEEGKKISDKFERERSNKLRQEIEKEFNLQVAEKAALRPERTVLHPVEYGKGDLKRDIAEVVNGILRDFKFSSFSQFNQLLGIYNVKAIEVPQAGKKPGLVYSAMNQDRLTVGAAFRASTLPYQPTMDRVMRRTDAGKKIKGDRAPRIRQTAQTQLGQSTGWNDFQQRLSRSGIEVIPHLGKENNLFGISFVDTRSRAIYTGSELGKSFTAGSLKATLGETYAPPSQRVVPEPEQKEGRGYTRATPRRQERAIKQTPYSEKKESINHQNQPTENQTPVHNLDLVRQLLYALNADDGAPENEQELKNMLKRSRLKPR